MIKNYGILWQRKHLHIGNNNNPGTLRGKGRKVGEVDFREQIGIYVLFDKDFRPIYIGQAGNGKANLLSRLRAHTHDHLWNRWEFFSWFGLRSVTTKGILSGITTIDNKFKASGKKLLDELEGILIAAMEPPLNKQGARFKDAEKYSQVVDPNLAEISLEDISRQIQTLNGQVEKLQKQLEKTWQ